MKKIQLLGASFLMLASISSFISCSKKDETKAPPTIGFSPSDETKTVDISGTPADITILVSVAADGEIDKFDIKKKVGGTESTYATITTFTSATAASYTLNYKGADQQTDLAKSTVIFTVTVTDKKAQTTTKTFTVTKKAVAYGLISTYTAKLMGAQGSATGSFFATTNGNVYLQTDAKTNSGLIDFLYFYGATKSAALTAPDDADAGTIFNNGVTGLQTWTTKNTTRFVTSTVTSSAFDAFSNDSAIVANVSAPVDTKESSLVIGNVIGFKTQAGKKGLIRVDALNSGASGDITITVKVQQ